MAAGAVVILGSMAAAVFATEVGFVTGDAIRWREGPVDLIAAARVAVITGQIFAFVVRVIGAAVYILGRRPACGGVALITGCGCWQMV
jgi:hypothetical protein